MLLRVLIRSPLLSLYLPNLGSISTLRGLQEALVDSHFLIPPGKPPGPKPPGPPKPWVLQNHQDHPPKPPGPPQSHQPLLQSHQLPLQSPQLFHQSPRPSLFHHLQNHCLLNIPHWCSQTLQPGCCLQPRWMEIFLLPPSYRDSCCQSLLPSWHRRQTHRHPHLSGRPEDLEEVTRLWLRHRG